MSFAKPEPADAPASELARSFDIKRITATFLADPFPTYRALREHDPVHAMPDGSFFLTRYEDCLAIYRDHETWRSDKRVDFRPAFDDSLLYEHHTTSLVFNDPPYHTRVRKRLAPAFTPRALSRLQPQIEALVDRLLDRAAERSEIDLIDDFAAAIPIQLIGDLLNLPMEERAPLRAWSLAILGALEPTLSVEQFDVGVRAVAEFKAYLAKHIRREAQAGRSGAGEVLAALIKGSEFDGDAPADERLSELELIHNCIFLLNAGHETTTNLIGNGIDLLIRHPAALADLRAHPELIDPAVEEFLRMESSNQLGNRRAARDTVLGETPVPTGTYVHIAIGAANRDPAQFADPDRLDIRRQPNRHLAFGTGVHACAGMSLARMEARVAIGKLVARFAEIEPAGKPMRGNRARFRGFSRYPVRLA
ncbi:MAG: cytochrome P450 [Beijerinckiaceae bacterium]